MTSTSRLKETLYLEVSQENVYPLIPSGRVVPATWQQTFTTFVENQRAFDLHLMRGNSDRLADNASLGKWRIAGIPPAPKGQHQIIVEIRAGIDGSVGIRATMNGQALPVTLLTEAFPMIPLTQGIPTIPLEKAIDQPCPECERSFVIRYTNWKNEPFALCLDCGHEFALEDASPFERTAPWEDLPPELIATLGIEAPHTPGGLDPDALRELQVKGFDLDPHEDPDLIIDADKILQQLPGMIFRTKKAEDLSVEDILRMAGDPLPEEQRRHCPKCDAVISRDAKRCEWCGQTL